MFNREKTFIYLFYIEKVQKRVIIVTLIVQLLQLCTEC